LPSPARSVPERCGRLVWRRARPCESRTRESYQSHDSNEPNQSYEPNAPHADESYDPNELSGPDESYDSGQ